MKTQDFFYELDDSLIAQTPIEPRDHSRLLVYNRKKDEVEHKHFYDIIDYLTPNDVLVINNTKVIPARLFGNKVGMTGKMEVFLLKRLNLTRFEVLVRPGRRIKVGAEIEFSPELSCKVIEELDKGGRIVEFCVKSGTLEEQLDKVGQMPLPPYIKEKLKDKNRYQTVYAKIEGSSAAPTAGLHFTTELLERIKQKGVQIEEVLLDVGLGTFRPVAEENIEDHDMHTERIVVTKETAKRLNDAKRAGKRIIAVGTTSVRTLESFADDNGNLNSGDKETSIFIYPGYKFKFVDAMITNFHLPCSTLLMLVSAFCEREKILNVYKLATKEKYRFFSFGDAMFLI